MKRRGNVSLSFAFVSLAFFGSHIAHAQANGSMAAMASADVSARASQEATQMVPAEVSLVQDLDARKLQAGGALKAKLSGGVHLANGTNLPRGTVLIGTAEMDQASGASKVVLRFTSAQLKNGTSVPIKATIVGMAAPMIGVTGTPEPTINTWSSQTLQVDQPSVLPGVNLHSSIASTDSGVLNASGKDDVKVGRNVQIALAIGAQGNN